MKQKLFNHCPDCLAPDMEFRQGKIVSCRNCGWVYFHNPAAAVGVFILNEGKILFTVRNQSPQKGMLDVPGGFVDPGESLEEAAIREIREELALEINEFSYLCSFPNVYPYRGISYNTCDSFFLARPDGAIGELNLEAEEIAGIRWIEPERVVLGDIAFDSIKRVLHEWGAKMKV